MIHRNAALNSSGSSRQRVQAEMWLAHMTNEGLLPDIVSYSSVINTLASLKQRMQAEMWLARMIPSDELPEKLSMSYPSVNLKPETVVAVKHTCETRARALLVAVRLSHADSSQWPSD